MPVGYVLVGDSRGHVEHDDTALALDVVPVPQTAKLLLTGGVPHVEADGAEVCMESEGVNLDSERCWTTELHNLYTSLIHSPMYFFSNSPGILLSNYCRDA